VTTSRNGGRSTQRAILSTASLGATRQSARAEALREAAEKLRDETEWYEGKVPGSHDKQQGYALGFYEAADFLESLASDNEGKADGNGG
jgi:hypothetical protein